jgi:hypothetical protein
MAGGRSISPCPLALPCLYLRALSGIVNATLNAVPVIRDAKGDGWTAVWQRALIKPEMNTKTIAIDFDGVIANSDIAKVRFARNELGLDVSEHVMKERYFIELFGEERGKQLYAHIIDSIYRSERMLETPMMPFSREGISKLRAAGWSCAVVTSRSGPLRDSGSFAFWAWRFLQQNGYEIESRDFLTVNGKSKLDVCLALDAHGLVDDDYSKIVPVIAAGLKGYLFSTQTNSEVEEEYPAFQGIRVADWYHLVSMLLSLPEKA